MGELQNKTEIKMPTLQEVKDAIEKINEGSNRIILPRHLVEDLLADEQQREYNARLERERS